MFDKAKKQKALSWIKLCGVLCMVIGLIAIFITILVIIFPDNSVPAIVGYLYVINYFSRWGELLVCVLLLGMSIYDTIKYKIGPSWYLLMAMVGLCLILLATIYPEIKQTSDHNDPNNAMSRVDIECSDSSERAQNKHWQDEDSLGGDPNSVAEDVLCSYLEYFFENGEEPATSAQILQKAQSYDVKQGIARVTIGEGQPEDSNVYNVLTHRSCERDNQEDDSTISVWFRSKDYASKEIVMSCVSASSYASSNIYDLQESREWYEDQFVPE